MVSDTWILAYSRSGSSQTSCSPKRYLGKYLNSSVVASRPAIWAKKTWKAALPVVCCRMWFRPMQCRCDVTFLISCKCLLCLPWWDLYLYVWLFQPLSFRMPSKKASGWICFDGAFFLSEASQFQMPCSWRVRGFSFFSFVRAKFDVKDSGRKQTILSPIFMGTSKNDGSGFVRGLAHAFFC